MEPSAGRSDASGLGSEQRQRLLKAKLGALVRGLGADLPAVLPEAQVRGSLTGIMGPAGPGFVLSEFGTPHDVAAAISWTLRSGLDELVMFVDFDAGAAARFASHFTSTPADGGKPFGVTVRSVSGAASEPAVLEAAPPALAAPEPPEELLAPLRAHDLEIVTEHGVTRAEVLGLEVARLVVWPRATGGDDELHLEVGVGRFDRDAVWAVSDGQDLARALGETVRIVRANRHPGAPPHPLQRLNRERWLRSMLLREPGLVGARELRAVGMTTEPNGMKDTHPAAALGSATDGRPLIVVTSIGVDLSAVPLAADLRAVLAPQAELVLAVPTGDVHRIQLELAALLQPAARVVALQPEWGARDGG